MVRGSLSNRKRSTEPADWRDWSAAGSIQYGEIQREAAGSERNHGGNVRSFRSAGTNQPDEGSRRRRGAEAAVDSEVCDDEGRAARGAREDGEAGSGSGRVDEGRGRADQRGAMLDVAGRKPGNRAVHVDEHDERLAAVERVRSGRLRSAGNACAAIGIGNAERASGLEQ